MPTLFVMPGKRSLTASLSKRFRAIGTISFPDQQPTALKTICLNSKLIITNTVCILNNYRALLPNQWLILIISTI